MWTVYEHVNKSNGKKYVGITSQTLKNRFGKNGSGYLQCPKFYNAIKKYGWDGFDHNIIKENITEDEAKKLEIKIIKDLNLQDDKYGYNMSSGGDGVSGVQCTEETKEKLRQAYYNMSPESKQKLLTSRIGIKLSQNHKNNIGKGNKGKGTKKVCQYSKEGKFIKVWNSLTEIHDELKIGIGEISSCCHGVDKQTGGYQWRFYTGDTGDIEPYIVDMSRHKIGQYDNDWNLIKIWNSFKEIKETWKKSTGNICSVCIGDRERAYGFRWKYIE